MRTIIAKQNGDEWEARVEGTESPIGRGRTHEDAVEDLHAELDGCGPCPLARFVAEASTSTEDLLDG
jgi:hypothetical protein